MSKKKRLEEQFEVSASSAGMPEDTSGSKERRTHSEFFTDRELDAMPFYTREELAAMPEPWTKRGEMISADKPVIQSLADKNRAAARIFVTGEVAESYIGEPAVRLLLNVNNVYYENKAGCEPLFINTRKGTVRMTRFDPETVWRCFHPDILVGLVSDEIDRLGVDMDPWKMDYFDFYQNMVAAMKAAYGDNVILMRAASGVNDFYQGVYLACLLLFGKPDYMDVPVAGHFAQKEAADFLRSAIFIQPNGAEQKELDRLREDYGSIRELTNPEMQFIFDLYRRVVKQ
jgi:hypothetical protein